METSYQPSAENIALFWQAPATLEHFAALEMALRNGVHLQRAHPDHYSLVSYLERHKNELNHHFETVYGWRLTHGGSQQERYYFLAPVAGEGARVPQAYRKEFSPEYVIVALLLCKISLMDFQISEFKSAEDLLSQLQDEYEPYRVGLFRHLAHVKGETETTPDEKKVVGWLVRCFKEFKQLGWLYEHPDGTLEIMPSLDRIREIYESEIKNLPSRYTPATITPPAA